MRNLGLFLVLFSTYTLSVSADVSKSLEPLCIQFFDFMVKANSSKEQPREHEFLTLIKKKLKEDEKLLIHKGGEGYVVPITVNGKDYYLKLPLNHPKYTFEHKARQWNEEDIQKLIRLQNIAAEHNLAPHIDLITPEKTSPVLVVEGIKDSYTLSDFKQNNFFFLTTKEQESWLHHFQLSLIEKYNKLSKLGIHHGDLKPENILVNKKGEVFFIDFGSAESRDINAPDPLKPFKDLESRLNTNKESLLGTASYITYRSQYNKTGSHDGHAISQIIKEIASNQDAYTVDLTDSLIDLTLIKKNKIPTYNKLINQRTVIETPYPIGLWPKDMIPAFYKERPLLRALILANEYSITKEQTYELAHQIHTKLLEPELWKKALNNIPLSIEEQKDFTDLINKLPPDKKVMILYGDKSNPILEEIRNHIFIRDREGAQQLKTAHRQILEDQQYSQLVAPSCILPNGEPSLALISSAIGKSSFLFIDRKAFLNDLYNSNTKPSPVEKKAISFPKNTNLSKWAVAAGIAAMATTLGTNPLNNSSDHAANADDEKKKLAKNLDRLEAQKETAKKLTTPILQVAKTLSNIASDLEDVMKEIEKGERKLDSHKEETKPQRPQLKSDLNAKQDCTCRGEWSPWEKGSRSRVCVVRDSKDKIIDTEAQSTDDPFCYNSCSPQTTYVKALVKNEKVIAACKSITRQEPKDWDSGAVGQGNNNEFWIPGIKLSKKAELPN